MTAARHILFWNGITIEITHTANWLNTEYDSVKIRTVPEEQPLPITKSGYLSDFIDHKRIAEEGDAATYVKNWLDWAAKTPEWAAHIEASRQLSLF